MYFNGVFKLRLSKKIKNIRLYLDIYLIIKTSHLLEVLYFGCHSYYLFVFVFTLLVISFNSKK